MTSTAEPPRLLVVSPSPDDRASSTSLNAIIAELRRRSAHVDQWYLRAPDRSGALSAHRVVDDLRTWPLARRLERLGVPRVPDALRGRRLAAWLLMSRPDAVLLDDGVGQRLFRRPVRPTIVRTSAVPSPDRMLEAAPSTGADIEIVVDGAAPVCDAPATILTHSDIADFESASWASAAPSIGRVRARLGTPDVPLVVGWGTDGWLDGPDLFVRILWSMEHRHGRPAAGLWIAPEIGDAELRRIEQEVTRCNLTHGLEVLRSDSADERICGDVTVLPARAPSDRHALLRSVASGQLVVTFPVNDIADPSVVVVDHLDVDAAASAAIAALDGDRGDRSSAAMTRLDVRPAVDRLLAAISSVALT